jgi:hypothetical protein
MRLRLENLWYRLRASYWFLPSLTAVAAIALSQTTVAMDETLAGRTQLPIA